MKLNFIVFVSLLIATVTSSAQTLTEVHFPQYIQGVGSFNAADDRKVPFVCRMTITGLTPGATYRFYNRLVILKIP